MFSYLEINSNQKAEKSISDMKVKHKPLNLTLAGVAQWIECWPVNQGSLV